MLNNINSIEELYEYMDKNIKYGWLGIDGIVRIDSLKGFKEYYKTMNVEDIINSGVGTCPDQVNLVKYYLDKNNIENKIYAIAGYENVDGVDKERVHFIITYRINDIWYQFEQASRFFRGIFEYGSLDDTKNMIMEKYKKYLKNYTLLEIEEIPVGINYEELRKIILKKLSENI